MAGTICNEVIQKKLPLEVGEEIVTLSTHMARLDDPYISSILTDPNNFREKMHYLSKEDAEHLE